MNETQDQVVWDAIGVEHNKLHDMYKEKINIEERHKDEISKYLEEVDNQTKKVKELCEGKFAYYFDSEKKLILDSTKEVKNK